MKLKLCGLRRPLDIEMANEASPDYIGFIFAPTRRYVSAQTAAALGKDLQPGIKKVGVFVNESIETLLKTAETADLDAVQLHGDETGLYIENLRKSFKGEIWKAIRVRGTDDIRLSQELPADMLLYDSFVPGEYGGTGKRIDLEPLLAARPQKPFFLAGGINAGNLALILSQIRPYGLDISSGFEVDGVKSREKLIEFIHEFERMNING